MTAETIRFGEKLVRPVTPLVVNAVAGTRSAQFCNVSSGRGAASAVHCAKCNVRIRRRKCRKFMSAFVPALDTKRVGNVKLFACERRRRGATRPRPQILWKGARLCAEHQPQQRKNIPTLWHSCRYLQKAVLRLAFSTAALRGLCQDTSSVSRSSVWLGRGWHGFGFCRRLRLRWDIGGI